MTPQKYLYAKREKINRLTTQKNYDEVQYIFTDFIENEDIYPDFPTFISQVRTIAPKITKLKVTMLFGLR